LLMMPGSALAMVVYCLVVLRTRLSRRRLEDGLFISSDRCYMWHTYCRDDSSFCFLIWSQNVL
jgi:hypothetical protein